MISPIVFFDDPADRLRGAFGELVGAGDEDAATVDDEGVISLTRCGIAGILNPIISSDGI